MKTSHVEPEASGLQPALKERLIKLEGKWIFKITDRVFLSQKDIRQVQLAKGAIRAGIEFLLESRGVKAQDVDKVLIAGSFGYHLRAKSLINIGLLPKEFDGKIVENVEVLEPANITVLTGLLSVAWNSSGGIKKPY